MNNIVNLFLSLHNKYIILSNIVKIFSKKIFCDTIGRNQMNYTKKDIILLVAIFVLFVGLRVPGFDASYHQDEYKWVYYTYQDGSPAGKIPHPPLAELLYLKSGPIAGINYFRVIPFVLGIINLFLIFYLAKLIFDKKVAFWTTFLVSVSFYSVLASLMVDVDGQFMPLFFLIMAISYYKLREKDFDLSNKNWLYLIPLVIGAVGGSLVKLSGVLPVGALALDFAIKKDVFKDLKKVFRYAFGGLIILLILGVLIYLSKYIFTYFDISRFMIYWKHFANSSSFLGRGWLQTFIQFSKSILYTSPLLVVPVFFINKDIWNKTRPLFLFVFVGTFFYLFAFDFSLGALDRYFQFFIIPFSIIAGAVFSKYLTEQRVDDKNNTNKIFFISIIISVFVFILQFLPHIIPALYPKTDWLYRLLSFKWNFLFPFTGGSGPLPFYVSFLFIATIWFVCVLAFVAYKIWPKIKIFALTFIMILGLVYNIVFIEEYLFGYINGNAEVLIKSSTKKIETDDNIKQVMVYNDNGGFQIQHTGKYFRRIYAVPDFEGTYRPIFEKYNGHILYIDIPRIAEDSMYKKYFNSCKIISDESNGRITSKIYDCTRYK